jgi:RHS repeat-associated protein
MARTAPVPNIPPIPGMCPSLAVLAGGGDGGGGGGGSAGDGDGSAGGSGDGSGDGAGGDGRTAPSDQCTREGEPVDVATGSVIHSRRDFDLSGVFSLQWTSTYLSSSRRRNDAGLGFGWSHSFAHRIEERRDSVVLTDFDGSRHAVRTLAIGERYHHTFGRWLFRVDADTYRVEFRKEALTREFRRVPGAAAYIFNLVRVSDRRGQAIELFYDPSGRLSSVRDTVGRDLSLRRDARGRILTIDGPAPDDVGRVTLARYDYDDADHHVAAADPLGARRLYAYDELHRLTSWTNRVGARVFYTYETGAERCRETWCELLDPSGIGATVPTRMKGPRGELAIKGGHHRVFDYAGGMTEAYDTYSSARVYGPDALGTVDKIVGAGGGVVTQKRDRHGQILQRIDARESVWEWKYDDEGRLVEESDPLGRKTRYAWGRGPVAERIVAPNGAEWSFAHDDTRTRVVDPLGSLVEYLYDERGLAVASKRDGREVLRARRGWHAQAEELVRGPNVTRFEYDRWGRRTAVISGDGGRTTYAYDLAGNLLSQRDALGRESRYEYDGEGRMIRVHAPDGTTRSAVHNGLGWLLAVTNAAGETSRLFYDWEGEVVLAVDARGEKHELAYTLDQYLREVKFPDGRVERYHYDKGGFCTQVRCNGRLLSERVFDAVGNLVSEEHADGSTHTFRYDALDFMVEAKNAAATVSFRRDACGNVLSEAHEILGKKFTVSNQIASDGVRLARDVGGVSVRLLREEGRVTGRWLDDELQTLEHDAMGRLTKLSRQGGLVIEHELTPIHLTGRQRASHPVAARVVDEYLTELATTRSSVERSYEYTPHLELGRVNDLVRNVATVLEYDPFGRLLTAREPGGDSSFAHDASSNIIRIDGKRRVVDAGNRVTRAGDIEVTYDAFGRVVQKSDVASDAPEWWRYEWGPYGLKEALHSSGKKVTFAYDALGRRVSKSVARGERTLFVWDGNSLAQEVRDGEAPVTYVFEDGAPFLPVAMKIGGDWLEVLSTPAGAPTELLDGSGKVVWSLDTHPYGAVRSERASPGVECNLGFQGQYRDRETGLSYNRFRTYDPELGMYLEPDPIGVDGGLNAWAYARNPIGWVDPLGLANGAALERAMVASGGPACPSGFQAHHVISEELYSDPRYSSLLGSNPHTAGNGIYLPDSQGSFNAHRASGSPPQPPGQTIHDGRHSSAYNNHIRSELDRINGLPPCQRQPELATLQNNLRSQLQNGTFTGTSTSGRAVSGLNCRGNVTP